MNLLNSALKAVWHRLPPASKRKVFSVAKQAQEEDLFYRLRDSGFYPDTVIDIGAYEGQWARFAHNWYPGCEFILVEAQTDKQNQLDSLPIDDLLVHTDVLSDSVGDEVEFYLHGSGSSYYRERADVQMETEIRTTTTLDRLVDTNDINNALLKLDVQGAEIDVLKGGSKTLESTGVVYLECSLIEYNEDAPMIEDVIKLIRDLGFVPFGIGDLHYWDNHLFQIDILFVDQDMKLASEWQTKLNNHLIG